MKTDEYFVPVVLGPTCSGKSAVALMLAELLGGAVVSCDSMQVYRDLTIGTAKPTTQDRRQIPHHLVDFMPLWASYNASQYAIQARAVLGVLRREGISAVVAGGTGMYARALVYNLPLLPSNPAVLAAVLARSQSEAGLEQLKQEIAAVAPADVAERLALNPRRLMRAVEVLRISGELPDEIVSPCVFSADRRFRQYVLMPEVEFHRKLIRRRTDAMLRAGWIEEVEALLSLDFLNAPTARQALGYREIATALRSGPIKLPELTETLFHKTVQYARRQRTWFRHQHPGSMVLAVDESTTVPDLVRAILANIGFSGGCPL